MTSIFNPQNVPPQQVGASVQTEQLSFIQSPPSEPIFNAYASDPNEENGLLFNALNEPEHQSLMIQPKFQAMVKDTSANRLLSQFSELASRAQGQVFRSMNTASLALSMKLPSHAAYAYKMAYQSVLSCLKELSSYESFTIEGEIPEGLSSAIASARSMLESLKGRVNGSMFNLCQSEGCGISRQDAEKLLSGDFQFEAQAMNFEQQKALRLLNGTLRENPDYLFSENSI